jgi:hypothetical protein
MMRDEPLATHFSQPLLKTPFHERARPLSQVDSFIPWAGYTTVDVFTTVEQEYFAIRNAATLYDLTPMVKYRIAGPDALRYLNRLVTRDIAKLKPDRVAYCVWCNDAGHVLDDGTVFRLGESEYRLCTAERQLDWLLDSAVGFDVEISETPSRSPRSRCKARPPAPCSRTRASPASSASSRSRSATSRSARARSWCRAPALPATWATRCGWSPTTPRASGMRSWRRAARAASGRSDRRRSTSRASRRDS